MPPVRSTDEIFIRAPQRAVARALLDLSEDASWWPGARAAGRYGWVEVDAPTGRPLERVRFGAEISPVREWDGFTWTITEGELTGRAEWWLEAFGEGTLVHHYLDGVPARGRRRARSRARRYRWALRRGLNALKDHLEQR